MQQRPVPHLFLSRDVTNSGAKEDFRDQEADILTDMVKVYLVLMDTTVGYSRDPARGEVVTASLRGLFPTYA